MERIEKELGVLHRFRRVHAKWFAAFWHKLDLPELVARRVKKALGQIEPRRLLSDHWKNQSDVDANGQKINHQDRRDYICGPWHFRESAAGDFKDWPDDQPERYPVAD